MSRVSGFRPQRPGRIHVRCRGCGRKQSNAQRHSEYDHPTAFLVEDLCDNCDAGCKDVTLDYYDKRGRQLVWPR